MVKISAALASLLCLAAPLRSASGTGVLAGRVVDAATQRPIAGASVSLHQWRGDGFVSFATKSDAGGGFSFTGLGVGGFDIIASAGADYLGGAVGKRRPLGDNVWITLAANERRDDLRIEMFRSASITGRVVDENDQPLAVSVQAWPRSSNPALGRREPPIRLAQFDSSETFRINELAPGEYVVVASVSHDTLREAPSQTGCALPPPPGVPAAAARTANWHSLFAVAPRSAPAHAAR